VSARQIQQTVMDFSDRFVSALWQSLDGYVAAEKDLPKQVLAQRMKVGLATTSMAIASSRDPRAGLLDMLVFVSAGKWAAGHHWIPTNLGPEAAGLAKVYEEMERDIWSEASRLLTEEQCADLRRLIAAWEAGNPASHEVWDVRLRNLEGVELRNFDESASARGLMASVRRLLGKVDQSLLYGERMMFYVERTPLILAQQSDLTVDRVAERFPIATVNPDFEQWGDLATALPQQINSLIEEREAMLRELLPEVRGSLESFDRIMKSLENTTSSVDSLAAKADQLPFKPEDYVNALTAISGSLDKLHAIVGGLNRLTEADATGTQAAPASQLALLIDERVRFAMDGFFYRAAALIALLIGGILLVLVVARMLFRPAPPTKASQPPIQ